jgi:putative transcriptional regulator
MTTKRKFKSDAFEAIHSSASALHRVGAIHETKMHEFEESCSFEPKPIPPKRVEGIREQES